MTPSIQSREDLPAEIHEHIHRIAYQFHVRAFGEELARVNFLPLEERRQYIAEMVDYAVSKGVKYEKAALGVTP
jgi:hypothetical protein